MTFKRVGYHRISDDSITSFTTPIELLDETLIELAAADDIDRYWTRDDNEKVDFDSHKGAVRSRPEHLSKVEIRYGRVYVTRQIEGAKAPFTKWDFLSDYEREEYAKITLNKPCPACGELLGTEEDFAKHYVVPDVQYYNLGYCPKKKNE